MTDLPEPTCVDCLAFLPEQPRENEPDLGRCQFRPELGLFPETLKYCSKFHIRKRSIGKVLDVTGKVPKARSPRHSSTSSSDEPAIIRATLENPITGDTSGDYTMDRDGLKQVLRELMEEETVYGYVEMGKKWEGGNIQLNPGNSELQSKEIPIDTFFKKIIMVRDKLRVLEAKLNSSDSLSAADKVEMQQYVSRAYGSLTSFNILFKNKEDQFSSK